MTINNPLPIERRKVFRPRRRCVVGELPAWVGPTLIVSGLGLSLFLAVIG